MKIKLVFILISLSLAYSRVSFAVEENQNEKNTLIMKAFYSAMLKIYQ